MRFHNAPQMRGAHWRDVYGGFGMGDFECVAVNFWHYRFFKPMCLCCFLASGFLVIFPRPYFPVRCQYCSTHYFYLEYQVTNSRLGKSLSSNK